MPQPMTRILYILLNLAFLPTRCWITELGFKEIVTDHGCESCIDCTLLAAPDRSTWIGRRDYALLLLGVQTGMRVSELVGLDRDAVCLAQGAHVRCRGKGRKDRCTPLTTTAVMTLKEWLREPKRRDAKALFPNMRGCRLSVDAVQYLIAKYVADAAERAPSLRQKRVSPHILRHSAAMELLQAGVECSVIALWLGHESIDTTQVYLHAHLRLKEAALAKLSPYDGDAANRFQPDDGLLAFLNAL